MFGKKCVNCILVSCFAGCYSKIRFYGFYCSVLNHLKSVRCEK